MLVLLSSQSKVWLLEAERGVHGSLRPLEGPLILPVLPVPLHWRDVASAVFWPTMWVVDTLGFMQLFHTSHWSRIPTSVPSLTTCACLQGWISWGATKTTSISASDKYVSPPVPLPQKTGHRHPRCERLEPDECEVKCCWRKHASWMEFSWMCKGWKNNSGLFWWHERGVGKLWHFANLCLQRSGQADSRQLKYHNLIPRSWRAMLGARSLHLLYVSESPDRVKLTVKHSEASTPGDRGVLDAWRLHGENVHVRGSLHAHCFPHWSIMLQLM